jgi:16S rRNA (guanine527-N7)-methyltransferase
MPTLAPDRSWVEEWIGHRAALCELEPSQDVLQFLAEHACRVLEDATELKLTSIRDPATFLERHIGESLVGASLIPRGTMGGALDLGSGNGYPGVPVAAIHRGLTMHLTEPSPKKAAFLESVVRVAPFPIFVLARQVQRSSDLLDLPLLEVVTMRAMGGWERIVPRLIARVAPQGRVILWAGSAGLEVARRVAWKGLELAKRRTLPGRTQSSVFVYYKKIDKQTENT